MSIQNKRQLENTRAKLRLLEARLEQVNSEPSANARTRELTKQSLKRVANKLKEEIIRFEAHVVTPAS
jgi:hypothetical protein